MKKDNDFASVLLAWYDREARTLPWRTTPTPYGVWVSEIMLQQTQVTTVIGYFERFMKRLPDIQSLAEVSEEELFKLWEGLGYYSRARNLQRAARLIVENYDGLLPNNENELRKLPGIGDYTAGAIASIAFQKPTAAVDGNVLRIFARLYKDDHDIGDTKNKKHFHALVMQVLPPKRAGDFNQALMDLGALICTPKAVPKCCDCPLKSFCMAYGDDCVNQLPVKSNKISRKIQQYTIFLIIHQEKILLKKRPSQGLLAGLWEYPNLEGILNATEARFFLQDKGVAVDTITPVGSAKHTFTHIQWQMNGYLVKISKPLPLFGGTWISYQALKENYALPNAYQFYTALLDQLFAPKDKQMTIFDYQNE